MTWSEFQISYQRSSSQLAALRDGPDGADGATFLDYWAVATPQAAPAATTGDNWRRFAVETHTKLLVRGSGAFPQLEIEAAIIRGFFDAGDFNLVSPEDPKSVGAIESEAFRDLRRSRSWHGSEVSLPTADFNPLDPEHPENEHRLLAVVSQLAGPRVAGFIHPQVPLDQLFGTSDFSSQRADFVLSLPNGKGLVLEPGDHGEDQALRDAQRDKRFSDELGWQTLRPSNRDIEGADFEQALRENFDQIGLSHHNTSDRGGLSISQRDGLLAAPLVHRIERCLVEHLFSTELWEKQDVTLRVIEHDAPAAGLGLMSFLLQQQKLHALYGRVFSPPAIRLVIHRVDADPRFAFDENQLLSPWGVGVEFDPNVPASIRADLVLDVSVTAGMLLPPYTGVVEGKLVVVRNAPPHQSPTLIPATAEPIPCDADEDLEEKILPFLQDLFRKPAFRDGQVAILRSILRRDDTIGLLPTGAGKSICYQLAGLLQPGTTLVISPIIALIDDQVEGLEQRYRIDATRAIHSGGSHMNSSELLAALERSCFVFVAPERLQRQSFRDALEYASGRVGQRISLAVIDEAHCVSMWGHDFRPAYLRLPVNLRRYCRGAFHQPPPLLSLTGTASHLVLVDLKRILELRDLDHNVIRPSTFVRPELNYRVIHCGKDLKAATLKAAVFPKLRSELKCDKLFRDQYGIVFDYTPLKLWGLIGEISAKYQQALQAPPSSEGYQSPPVDIYTGSCPVKTDSSRPPTYLESQWDTHKKDTFRRFARGEIHCLFGNNAVGVGIDNEKVSYVVNMSMPQSLEDYYQQAGRAGRGRQVSFCYLLYAEKDPATNDKWFLREGDPEKGSDVANAEYFHRRNFPGEKSDREALELVLRVLVNARSGSPVVRYDGARLRELSQNTPLGADDSQRFLGYLILLGIVEDYTVEGMKGSTAIRAKLNEKFWGHLGAQDWAGAEDHVTEALWNYYERYQPTDRNTLQDEIGEIRPQVKDGKFLTAACHHLVDFLYSKIEYQRRNAIRAITDFCRQAAGHDDRAASIIRDYFDRSRFSTELLAMRTREPDYKAVTLMIGSLTGKAEAEQIFWETGRLLSETGRGDWLLTRISARLYLGLDPELAVRELRQGVDGYGAEFLVGLAEVCSHMLSRTGMKIWQSTIKKVILATYPHTSLRQTLFAALSSPDFPADLIKLFSNDLALVQLRNLNDILNDILDKRNP